MINYECVSECSISLPPRHGDIRAVVTSNNPRGADLASLADAAVCYFRRRGLPITATPFEAFAQVTLIGRFDPSRYPQFSDVFDKWIATGACTPLSGPTETAPAVGDDEGGFHLAWAREARCRAWLDRIARDLGLGAGAGGRWAQVVGGAQENLPKLEAAFHALRRNGRISRFPNRGITVARQATCAPYGLPAVLLSLKGTCRVFSERIGMRLLEANPRIVAMTEVAPAVVLFENTPPLDNVWDEARFWAAWRSLPQAAWDGIVSWAAVRVLRRVEVGDRCWKFYDHSHLPRNIVQRAEDLAEAPSVPSISSCPDVEAWRKRRACEIALALQLGVRSEPGLRRHVIGCLATPYPFVHALKHDAEAIVSVDEWLSTAAASLHAEIACEEKPGVGTGAQAEYRAIAVKARAGLQTIQQGLLAGVGETIVCRPLAPCG